MADRLTDKIIDVMQNYYGMVIRNNVSMQKNVLATLHLISSTSSEPNHLLRPT